MGHMGALLGSWEKDNSLVYFDKVPPSVPANKALKAIHLKKVEEYVLEVRDPLPLGPKVATAAKSIGSGSTDNLSNSSSSHGGAGGPPSYDQAILQDPRLFDLKRSDSDLARELDEKLN